MNNPYNHQHENGSKHGSYGHGGNPYIQISATPASEKRPMDRFCDALNRCGKKMEDASRKAEALADGVRNHLKFSPSITDAALARLAQGTRLLTEGGHDKVFWQQFGTLPREKLSDAYVCYISTTSGPVIGTIYISNKRLAFCSDYPLRYQSPTGQLESTYYKVVLQLDKIRSINQSANALNPSEKYIHIVMQDGYEFWLMGFVSYNKALKRMTDALQHPRELHIE